MIRYYFPSLVAAAAAFSLGACSSATTQGGSHTNRVIATSSTERQTDNSATSSTATTVSMPPAEMLAALSAAYSDLGIEVKLWNPPAGEVGNRNFAKIYRLAGAPLSTYVGCGVTTTGAAADNYRVTMSLVSHVTPNGTGGSTVVTRLTAYAEDISSSKGTLACMTLGTLEERIQELALKHARS